MTATEAALARRLPRFATRRRVAIAVAGVVGVLSLATAYAEKARCFDPARDGWSLGRSCYSDVSGLYVKRGFDRPGIVPYLDGDGDLATPDGDFEYPPGTGAIVATALATSDDGPGFFRVNAILLGGLAALAFVALATLASRPWRLAAVLALPTFALHAFTNWDLAPMAFIALGVWAAARDRPGWAGIALGLGAACKFVPGVLIPVVAAAAWMRAEPERRWRQAAKPVVAGIGAFAAVVVPVLLVAPHAWATMWSKHLDRMPSPESAWHPIGEALGFPDGFGVWSGRLGALIVVAVAAAVIAAEARRRERFRIAAVSVAVLAVWIVTAKIFSPQATLWIAGLLALVAIPKWLLVAFAGSEILTIVAHTGWYRAQSLGDPSSWWPELRWSIAVRVVVLVAIAVAALRSGDLIAPHGPRLRGWHA